MVDKYGASENLTLTQEEIDDADPVGGEGDQVVRMRCPFHGSDKQRSLRLVVETGRFNCFSCEAWGYTEEARAKYKKAGGSASTARRGPRSPNPTRHPSASTSSKPLCDIYTSIELEQLLDLYREALPGSRGERELTRRGIPLKFAQEHRVGYAPVWPKRQWTCPGRLVFPHTDPLGQVVNLYGRAIRPETPREYRHDHFSLPKGYFNARALKFGEGPVYVCEGVFDALSLIAAGRPRTVAIFGVNGWRWEWANRVKHLCFAFDADETGQASWRPLARAAVLRGLKVSFLPASAYGGCKDINEAWVSGALDLQDGQ